MRGLVEGQVRLGPWKDKLLVDPTLLMEAYLAAAEGLTQNHPQADSMRAGATPASTVVQVDERIHHQVRVLHQFVLPGPQVAV
jgi:hypothetical protein